MPYQVQTPVFEGPFDLLLHLITREQVDLYQVSLSEIVDAYLAELERLEPLDLEIATEFLVIAATLVELKTRRLLPGSAEIDIDEELAVFEERDLLLARLLECKTFRDAGEALARLAATAERLRPRTAGLEERYLSVAPDLLANVAPEDLRAALVRASSPKPPPRVDLDHVAPVRASVRDAVNEMLGHLATVGTTTFRRLTETVDERLELIVRFLAVLELYKEGLVDLDQATTFGDLAIIWIGDQVNPAAAAAAALAGADRQDG